MIPQCDPGAFVRAHGPEIERCLRRVLESGAYVLGAEVGAFEREFARAFDLGFAVGVGNGTDALSLALRALGVGAGAGAVQRVATVSHTAVATVAAIEMAGAAPVFIDINGTFTMDVGSLARALEQGDPIHAIVAVHLYGQPADLEAILPLAAKFGIPVIEDCAQAHGARLGDKPVGSLGDAAAFSFYPTKNLGCLGDGGMVSSRDASVAATLRRLRQYGWREDRVSMLPGINSRLDELQAAILRLRLAQLDAGNRRRREIAAAYDRGLNKTGLSLPRVRPGSTHVYHQYVIRHPDRDGLKARLADLGVGTNIHYPLPAHAHPAYLGRCRIAPAGLAETEAAAREVLSLPMYPELSDAGVAEVIDAVSRSL
jgi:dTDP-4-amino-4,6-dideoxygalactose transaminase